MKRAFLLWILAVSTTAMLTLFSAAAPESDPETVARRTALDVAGAFGNDGFKMRDGHWSGPLVAGKAQLIQVSLFAGNQYWFTLGATPQAKKLGLNLFDESGKLMSVDLYTDTSRAAAGFAPQISGPYYIQIKEIEGEPATFCLIYSYK